MADSISLLVNESVERTVSLVVPGRTVGLLCVDALVDVKAHDDFM